jgi:hypothetical protein
MGYLFKACMQAAPRRNSSAKGARDPIPPEPQSVA